jgi:ATP-dependent DNA helicase PIF1
MQLPMDQLEKMVEQNDQLRLRLAEMDVLIIDEISMVENIFFSRINRLMQAAKENNEPFGGVQLIVCGDFRQLAPVKPFSYCFACGRTTTKDRDRERRSLYTAAQNASSQRMRLSNGLSARQPGSLQLSQTST